MSACMMNNAVPVLNGQRALVTGASSGIGAGVARALGAAGAKVVVNYNSGDDQAMEVVTGIRAAGGDAVAVKADVSREDDVEALFEAMFRAYDGIDILVNNAGLQRDAPFIDMQLPDWRLVLDINLTGQFLCAREAARQFIRQGVIPRRSRAAGKVICMSSVHDVIPWGVHFRPRAASACS